MDTCIVPREVFDFADIPDCNSYVLANCSVPLACMRDAPFEKDSDDLVRCNIHISGDVIHRITDALPCLGLDVVDLEGGCVFPTFVDLHTHIGALGAQRNCHISSVSLDANDFITCLLSRLLSTRTNLLTMWMFAVER
jgi:hypothetical protein